MFLQRNACARAAESGAVSAFRTASSNDDATNLTLWTWRITLNQLKFNPITIGTYQTWAVGSNGLDGYATNKSIKWE